MKIGILTQPLQTNYGGLLQAYALQIVLKKMGHDVLTIDVQKRDPSFIIKGLSIIKRFIRSVSNSNTVIRAWPTKKEKKIIGQHTSRFIKENIATTTQMFSIKYNSHIKNYKFEAYIVGSDQVWRPSYSISILDYFFNFLNKDDKAKRIAYAASFGNDDWEFSIKETDDVKELIKRFDFISVREDSAVNICNEYLKVDAEWVLDPTMLLLKDEYIALIEKDNISKSKGELMCYILDGSHEKDKIIQGISKKLSLKLNSVIAEAKFSDVGKSGIDKCIFPPITEWLRGFLDSKFVITDSFHGTVFSIIFNKPFITIANTERGITRFTSLLKMFELEDRLITTDKEFDFNKLNQKIDYLKVNRILEKEKKRALVLLKNSICNEN